MNVNKLLKLVGPKLKQDELDVFLGEVLFADQSYGDSQVSLQKYHIICFVNVVSIWWGCGHTLDGCLASTLLLYDSIRVVIHV